MKSGHRNYDLRRIKRNMSYSVEDVGDLLDVHTHTVRLWIKAGLPLLDARRPCLIHGTDLAEYLREKQTARRHRCQDYEMFCCKCHCPRAAAGAMADIKIRNRKVAGMSALCAVCSTVMYRAIAVKDIEKFSKIFITAVQGLEHINDTH